jgi:hypothetical protein
MLSEAASPLVSSEELEMRSTPPWPIQLAPPRPSAPAPTYAWLLKVQHLSG